MGLNPLNRECNTHLSVQVVEDILHLFSSKLCYSAKDDTINTEGDH